MSNLFDIPYLRKYVNGELSSAEMFAIEKASHEDEMLMDIIMGLEEEKALKQPLDQGSLDALIYERTHPRPVRRLLPYKALGIAASLLLVLGIGTIWWLNQPKETQELSMEAASAPLDAPTDTTLNSIILDSIDDPLDSLEQLIAAAPIQEQQHNANALRAARQNNKQIVDSKNNTLQIRPDVFLDTSAMKLPDNLIAKNNRAASLNQVQAEGIAADNSSVIMIRGAMKKESPAQETVSRMASPQDLKKIITGEVLDLYSGRPIPQATVRNLKTNQVVVTDSSGGFILPVSLGSTELEILSIGYNATQIIAKNNQKIKLKPAENMLDEVVIAGQGSTRNSIKSEPLIGWRAYKKYINDSSKETLYGRGDVTLVFDISNFGRPIDIRVKKSVNSALDQQAIQIIKNGPDWKKGNDGKLIEVKIRF